MPKKKTAAQATTAVNPGSVLANINLPKPSGENKKGPKFETVEVGMFRLPGVKVDVEQFSEEQLNEMRVWAQENGAYPDSGNGLFSWRDPGKRDWFILKWS